MPEPLDPKAPVVIAPERGPLPRREFLRRVAAAGAAGAVGTLAASLEKARAGAPPEEWTTSFPDGIKSGDPQPHGSVLWTRIQAPPDGRPVPVVWSVSEDPDVAAVVRGGVAWARSGAGHTVKVRVDSLRPDRWYYYRFEAAGASSVVGRLRTSPDPTIVPNRLRYAFASCQQRTASHYVAHRAIMNEGVDFWMHLGDYIYVHDSADLTLENYRNRYRLFQSNPLLQELQAKVPIVAMWDDGEFYNGVDRTGDPIRLEAARTAWFENMPVQRPRRDRVYRSFRWGRLADVIMIDVRSYRDPEVPANVPLFGSLEGQDSRTPPSDQMFAPGRTTLGARQKRWLKGRLRHSRANWRLIGNPYNINPWRVSDLDTPQGRIDNPNFRQNEGIYVSNEAWDDYQLERREITEMLARYQIPNVVFTSGHTHIYLASELMPDFDDATSPVVAFDFTTGSLTADPDPLTIAPIELLRAAEQIMIAANNPYLKHVDILRQGYAIVDVTPEECIVEFRAIDTFDPDAEPYTSARFRVVSGGDELEVLYLA